MKREQILAEIDSLLLILIGINSDCSDEYQTLYSTTMDNTLDLIRDLFLERSVLADRIKLTVFSMKCGSISEEDAISSIIENGKMLAAFSAEIEARVTTLIYEFEKILKCGSDSSQLSKQLLEILQQASVIIR